MPTDSPSTDPDPQESMMRPPWEPASRALAAAPVQDDIPDDESQVRKAHSGPMYVWNPATNSGPFPAANGKDSASEDATGKDSADEDSADEGA